MSDYNPFTLKGKTILVTGASSGIGQATAIECSRLGATLVVTGRNGERLQATFDRLEGTGHRQVVADFTGSGGVRPRDGDGTEGDGLARLVEACPELDGVVLCAGIATTLPIAFSTPEKFAEVFDVNFSAPVECLRLLFKRKKIARSASVVFVSSLAGQRGGTATGEAIYGASKAALSAVMRYFVKEFSLQRVRFNSVNPAVVNTPLIDTPIRSSLTEEQRAADLRRYPLGRYGEPQDVAHGIIYLLSDAASWVTGHQLVLDGGMTI